MKSRMERYYNNEIEDNNERVKKNEELYDTIYNFDPLLDVEEVNNATEIDLENIKNIAERNREEYRKLRQYKRLLNADDENNEFELEPKTLTEEKVYDINSILEKAKMDRLPSDDREKYRKLKNTQYDILNSLNIGEKTSEMQAREDFEAEKAKLKDLINTITMNKKDIDNFITKDDSNHLLDDLMPMDNTIITESVQDTNKVEVVNTEEEHTVKTDNVDQSFYTSSLSFSKTDFEGVKNLESTVKVNNILIKILLFILLVIVTTVILFVVNNYIDLNIFKK